MGPEILTTFLSSPLALLYADPGSGTLIWQLIAAAAFGLLFYSKLIVQKVRLAISSKMKRSENAEEKVT